MKNFFGKIAGFMQDRYGSDKLNNFILILVGVLFFINIFVKNTILMVVTLVLLVLVMLRSFSKNINRRSYENRKFIGIYTSVFDFFKRQYMKIRDFRTHRYVRCPHCKAQLRLKKRTGVQHIHCPRCKRDFKKNILF